MHERNGRAALTFTDGTSHLFNAYLHLLEAWIQGTPQMTTLAAMKAVVSMLQPREWQFAAEAIAHSADWLDVGKLWPRIKPAGAPDFFHDGDHLIARRPEGAL